MARPRRRGSFSKPGAVWTHFSTFCCLGRPLEWIRAIPNAPDNMLTTDTTFNVDTLIFQCSRMYISLQTGFCSCSTYLDRTGPITQVHVGQAMESYNQTLKKRFESTQMSLTIMTCTGSVIIFAKYPSKSFWDRLTPVHVQQCHIVCNIEVPESKQPRFGSCSQGWNGCV